MAEIPQQWWLTLKDALLLTFCIEHNAQWSFAKVTIPQSDHFQWVLHCELLSHVVNLVMILQTAMYEKLC